MGSPSITPDPFSPAALHAYVGRKIEFLMIGRPDLHENGITVLDPVFADKGLRPDHERQARFHCANSHLVSGCHLNFGRWRQGAYKSRDRTLRQSRRLFDRRVLSMLLITTELVRRN